MILDAARTKWIVISGNMRRLFCAITAICVKNMRPAYTTKIGDGKFCTPQISPTNMIM